MAKIIDSTIAVMSKTGETLKKLINRYLWL